MTVRHSKYYAQIAALTLKVQPKCTEAVFFFIYEGPIIKEKNTVLTIPEILLAIPFSFLSTILAFCICTPAFTDQYQFVKASPQRV